MNVDVQVRYPFIANEIFTVMAKLSSSLPNTTKTLLRVIQLLPQPSSTYGCIIIGGENTTPNSTLGKLVVNNGPQPCKRYYF